ncbi:CPBP family intramembrane metalloprotease [Salinirubellus salinus]|uniref:CPBP family intramembrane metalloprotease n=1 Tax=Salinirubellus salinus TaxID=1364945 RepID=A0A9E7QZC8_9EURY|nr:CPBP family intramembrane glutamic endopeptidase [Salinirubellus salinus]UWM52732.1 CPBP family intramembrane metalloprotease [Salinirubellus salinus]
MSSTASEVQHDSRSGVSVAVVVGLFLSLFGGPLLGQIDLPGWIESSTASSMLANSLGSWLLVGVLLGLVVYWEGRGVASIGLRLPTRTEVAVGLGAGLGAVVLGLLVTGVAVVTLNLDQPETLSAISRLSLPIQLAIVGTAVVVEEILWRGYPIERLTELTGHLWVGAAISGVVFLAVHYPAWGLVGAIPQAVFTVVLVGVYVWSRNVVASMLTHGVINVVMVLVLPAFL